MKNLEQLTIGKMASMNRVSEQALRLYDKMDLFTPQGVNPQNGYRYYTIGQSAQLDLIQYYQNIGFSLKDIKNKLMSPDANQINHHLTKRLAQLQQEIRQMENCCTSIQSTLNSYQRYQSLPKNNQAFLEYLPKRKIIVYDSGSNMYEYDYNHYEYILRQFKNYLRDIKYDVPLFGNVGTIIRKQHLEEQQLISNELFLFAEDVPEYFPNTEVIPDGTYLSLCCRDFEHEARYARRLFHEAHKMNLQIQGDYYCEVMSEYPELSAGKRTFYYKIQIRVS